MHNTSNKGSDQSSIYSTSPCFANCPSWWNSTESQFPQATLSQGLSLRMESPPQHCRNSKQLSLQAQEQDSSSTQSTGQSHNEMSAVGGGNPQEKGLSAQSGYNDIYERRMEGHTKPALSLGTPNFVLSSSQVEYNQPVAHILNPYAHPYFGGILAAYGPHAIIHPQMVGMLPVRIPLPLDLTEDEPIFVNAKQYNGILRRRKYRAKLEAQNKLVKNRKPYLHESRHLHALKRARGSGGRFLDTKKLRQSKPTPASVNLSESEFFQSEMGNAGVSATSCSDITSVSNCDDIFPQPDLRFSDYPLHMQGGGTLMHSGSQPRVPVMR